MYTREIESFGNSILNNLPLEVPASDAVQVQPRKAKIGEQAGRLGAKALAAGAFLTDEDAVLGAAVVVVNIAVIDRPDGLAVGVVEDDILHDLAGGDLRRQPAAVHLRREGLAEDEVLHDRRRVAPLDDKIRVGVGDGAQRDRCAGQDGESGCVHGGFSLLFLPCL